MKFKTNVDLINNGFLRFAILIFICFLTIDDLKSQEPNVKATHNLINPICIDANGGLDVCKGESALSLKNGADNSEIVILKNGVEKERWFSGSDNSLSSTFEIFDLNGPGNFVISDFQSATQGIGLRSYEINVINLESHGYHLRFDADEFSKYLFKNENKKIKVMVTEWVETSNQNGKDGHAFVARPFLLMDGSLFPDQKSPILKRQLNKSLEYERDKKYPSRPDIWLKKGDKCNADPLLTKRGKKEDVVITGVTKTTTELIGYELLLAGADEKIKCLYPFYVNTKTEGGIIVDRLGDFKTGRLFPRSYIPTDMSDWIKNRKAILEVMPKTGNDIDNEKAILWIK